MIQERRKPFFHDYMDYIIVINNLDPNNLKKEAFLFHILYTAVCFYSFWVYRFMLEYRIDIE